MKLLKSYYISMKRFLFNTFFIIFGIVFYYGYVASISSSPIVIIIYIILLIKFRRAIKINDRGKNRKAIPKHIRSAVLKKYNYECAYCGSEYDLEIDHIYPYSKGGSDSFKNLQVLCRSCNRSKSDKIPFGVRKR